jgi:hypothetical protein
MGSLWQFISVAQEGTDWELPHHARALLRIAVQGQPETAGSWLRVYRIEMGCEVTSRCEDQ